MLVVARARPGGQLMRRPDPCGCPTSSVSPAEAVLLLRALYAAGISYHLIAEITRLNLSHADVRRFLLLGDPERQALHLEAVMAS